MRFAVFAAVLVLAACDTTEVDPPAARAPATFAVTFEATWSAATHPDAFPPDPHFSRLTGATHAIDVSLWRVGSPASDGVSGRLLAAPWDPWATLDQHAPALARSDIYTLRRILPEERAQNFNG